MSQVLKVTGIKLNSNLISTILGGLGSIYIGVIGTSNTFLIHQYQSLFQAFENSNPIEIPDKLEQRFRKVLQELQLEESDRVLGKVFMSIRPDLHHIGLTGSRFSFRIGLPLKFSYNSVSDINPNMKIESKFVDWNSDEGKTLQKSLVLSENAQKFAIAQEVYKCDMTCFYLQLLYPVLSIMSVYYLGVLGNQKFHLSKKPLQARTVFYSGACFFAYGLYVLLTDKTHMILEKMSLRKLSSMGSDYIEGGIEFFDKQLKINQVLRKLLHNGEDTIASTGNANYFIRQKSLPLTYQKSFLEDELKKLRGQDAPIVEDVDVESV